MARYSLAQVETWLAEAELSWARLGPAGVGLLEALTESDTPAAAAPAVALAHRLCDRLVEALDARLTLSEADSARLFSLLLTLLAEVGQYRHETFADGGDQGRQIETLLAEMADVREHVILVAKTYLQQPVFDSLRPYLEQEIFPLLESLGDPRGQRSPLARDRYMPFRVVQVGNIAERLHGFRLRTGDPRLVGERASLGLLSAIYARKVVRFGTSGVRGRWGQDFTEARAKVVVQAICDYLRAADVPERVGAENLQGRRIVIGYDTRENARLVARWVAQVCLGNGFDVELAYRDAPTPALVYYMTDHLPEGDVAGLINCTASHNPPEWQGIKFNPRQGFPAPSSLTNFIAARATRLQLLDECTWPRPDRRTPRPPPRPVWSGHATRGVCGGSIPSSTIPTGSWRVVRGTSAFASIRSAFDATFTMDSL